MKNYEFSNLVVGLRRRSRSLADASSFSRQTSSDRSTATPSSPRPTLPASCWSWWGWIRTPTSQQFPTKIWKVFLQSANIFVHLSTWKREKEIILSSGENSISICLTSEGIRVSSNIILEPIIWGTCFNNTVKKMNVNF